MTTRQEVYDAITGERAYQESRWKGSGANPNDPRQHELDAWVTYIVDYTDRLLRAAASRDGTDKTDVLNFVRKVAALCVVAMEQHGAPRREGF
jgi:hypothetical protein